MISKTVALVIGVVALVAVAVGVMLAVNASKPSAVPVETRTVISVPVTYDGMQCTEDADTNGNTWINDCVSGS